MRRVDYIMQNKNIVVCPNCNGECYINLDEFGYTPWHIHCNNCNINIGATKIDECIKLLNKYHNKNTYLEYYKDKIKLLIIEKEVVINAE